MSSSTASSAVLLSSPHYLFLIQSTSSPSSRTYSDFPSLSSGLDYLLSLFESKLKSSRPQQERITYSVEDFYSYVDSLYDCVALEFDGQLIAYLPRNKEWIKSKALEHIKKQAGVQ